MRLLSFFIFFGFFLNPSLSLATNEQACLKLAEHLNVNYREDLVYCTVEGKPLTLQGLRTAANKDIESKKEVVEKCKEEVRSRPECSSPLICWEECKKIHGINYNNKKCLKLLIDRYNGSYYSNVPTHQLTENYFKYFQIQVYEKSVQKCKQKKRASNEARNCPKKIQEKQSWKINYKHEENENDTSIIKKNCLRREVFKEAEKCCSDYGQEICEYLKNQSNIGKTVGALGTSALKGIIQATQMMGMISPRYQEDLCHANNIDALAHNLIEGNKNICKEAKKKCKEDCISSVQTVKDSYDKCFPKNESGNQATSHKDLKKVVDKKYKNLTGSLFNVRTHDRNNSQERLTSLETVTPLGFAEELCEFIDPKPTDLEELRERRRVESKMAAVNICRKAGIPVSLPPEEIKPTQPFPTSQASPVGQGSFVANTNNLGSRGLVEPEEGLSGDIFNEDDGDYSPGSQGNLNLSGNNDNWEQPPDGTASASANLGGSGGSPSGGDGEDSLPYVAGKSKDKYDEGGGFNRRKKKGFIGSSRGSRSVAQISAKRGKFNLKKYAKRGLSSKHSRTIFQQLSSRISVYCKENKICK